MVLVVSQAAEIQLFNIMRLLFTIPFLFSIAFGQKISIKGDATKIVISSSGSSLQVVNTGETNVFTFTLPGAAYTSAGVYDVDTTLVRTLWSYERYTSGPHSEKWDGLKDDRTQAPTNKTYFIQVLSHNVQYAWDGARIGNTSTALTGSSIHRGYQETNSISIAGGKMFYSNGYHERFNTQYVVDLNNIGVRTRVIPATGGTNQVTTFNCTDGTYVYWFGYFWKGNSNPNIPMPQYNFVFATRCDNNAQVSFTNGTTIHAEGVNYSGISLTQFDTTFPFIGKSVPHSGAVQKNGICLFVVRPDLNQVQVLNKTTGQYISNLTFSGVNHLAIDATDNLWISSSIGIRKYSVDGSGNLTYTGINITGITEPNCLAVSPDNATIIVGDAGITQQVLKGFNNSTGASLWTFGTPGGYQTDATVTNNKFYFHDFRDTYKSSIAFEADGSFWVNEPMNNRIQHYSTNRVYLNRIMYLNSMYQTNTITGDSSRLLSGSSSNYLEFKIDYNKPLDNGQNGSWVHTKNWGGQLPPGVDPLRKMQNSVFLDGKTYTTISRNGGDTLYELVPNGVARKIGRRMNDYSITNDGELIVNTNGYSIGIATGFNIYNYTGLSNGNPTWSVTPSRIITTPVKTNEDATKEKYKLFGNNIYFFDSERSDDGIHYHIAGAKSGKWSFKASPSTLNNYEGPYPDHSEFENRYQNFGRYGATLDVVGRHFFYNYAGEGSRFTQTNMFLHFLTNGLYVGKLGTVRSDYGDAESPAGGGGNPFTLAGVLKNNDTAYLYANDEGVMAGVQRWRITNLSSINIQNCQLTSSSSYRTPAGGLMAGLVKNGVLSNGWTQSHPNLTAQDYSSIWVASVGDMTASKYGLQDVRGIYRQEGSSDKIRSITRPLGTNVSSNWKLTGELNFTGTEPAADNQGVYSQILDHTGKAIASFCLTEPSQDNGSVDLRANGEYMQRLDYTFKSVINKTQPFSVEYANGLLTFKYATYSLSTEVPAESGADLTRPTTYRVLFTPAPEGASRNRSKGLSSLLKEFTK